VLWDAVRTWDEEALPEEHPAMEAADRLDGYIGFKITDADSESVQGGLRRTREVLHSLRQAISTS
jgi:hypothetical protein